jgi:hypothetical protein
MPYFSNPPRPNVSPRPHSQLSGDEPLLSAKDSQLGGPDLFWATRLNIQEHPPRLAPEPKPAAIHPRSGYPEQPLTTIEHYRFQGLPAEDEFPSALRRAWQAHWNLTPRETFRALLRSIPANPEGGEVTAQRAGDWFESVEIALHLNCPRTGAFLGTVEQELSFLDGDSIAQYGCVEDDLGWEVEKTLLENSVKLYDQVGIFAVHLQASGARGYTWAKCGFVPESEEDAWELFNLMRQRAERFELTSRVRTVIGSLLSDPRPEVVWAIADLDRVKVACDGRNLALGRALLDGACWPGLLDLDNPVARNRLERSLRRV